MEGIRNMTEKMNRLDEQVSKTQSEKGTAEKVTAEKAAQEKGTAEKAVSEKTVEQVKSLESAKNLQSRDGDEYIRSKAPQPSGLYNIEKDKDGKFKIMYEDSHKETNRPNDSLSVTELKRKKDSIKLKIKTETDENRIRELKKKLKNIEKQIKKADNE